MVDELKNIQGFGTFRMRVSFSPLTLENNFFGNKFCYIDLFSSLDYSITCHRGLILLPLNPLLDDMSKDDMTIATGTCHLGAVSRPRDLIDASRCRLVQGVRPADLITESQSVEGSHGKELAIHGPGHGRDGIVVLDRVVELSAVLVPYTVTTVLTPGDDAVV